MLRMLRVDQLIELIDVVFINGRAQPLRCARIGNQNIEFAPLIERGFERTLCACSSLRHVARVKRASAARRTNRALDFGE